MSTHKDLLRVICAQPDEDTPRLAYADWLDEHAEFLRAKKRESAHLRAELIRVQCELARLPQEEENAATAIRRIELEERAEELLKNTARRKSWARPLHPPPPDFPELRPFEHRFVRGFPYFATGDAAAFLAAGESLFDINPVEVVNCRNIQGELADRFLAQPWLTRVRRMSTSTHLDTSGWEERPDGRSWRSSSDGTDVGTTEKLFAAANLANLEDLELSSWEFGKPGGEVAVRGLTSLRRLQLWGGISNGPATFERLGELLPDALTLREFELASVRFGPAELRSLGELPQMARLQRLQLGLRYSEVWWQPTPLGVEGVRAITSAPYWKFLHSFHDDMGEEAMTETEFMELAAASPAPGLLTLRLNQRNDFGRALNALAESPLLTTVTTLDLSNHHIGDSGATLLAKSPYLRNLLHLKLDRCQVGPKGVKALAGAPFAANLVRLSLEFCPIRKAGVDALVAPGAFPKLRRLELRGAVKQRVQKEGLRARFGSGVLC